LLEHFDRLLDLAAAVALQVARIQRLEFHDQRELLASADFWVNRYQPIRVL